MDPTSHSADRHAEHIWGSHNWRSKMKRTTRRDFLETYLAEFMCRACLMRDDPFFWALKEIASFRPPEVVCSKTEKPEENGNDVRDIQDQDSYAIKES